MDSQQKMDSLRNEIANLVSLYAKEQYKPKDFIPGETIIPPSGKLLGEEELQNMVAEFEKNSKRTGVLYGSD